MAHTRSRWVPVLAAAAMVCLPFSAARAAQDHHRQQPHEHEQAREDSPRHHLEQARQALERIDEEQLEGQARQQFAELRRHFEKLERSADVHERPETEVRDQARTVQPEAPRRPEIAPEVEPGVPVAEDGEDWQAHYTRTDRALTELLGSPPVAEGAPIGTAGMMEQPLDSRVRTQLQDFSRHLHQFNAAMDAAPGVRTEPHDEHPADERPTPVTPPPGDRPAPEQPGTVTPRPDDQAAAPQPTPKPAPDPAPTGLAQDTARDEDPQRHIERLEALLNQALSQPETQPDRPLGTAGEATVCVDRATLQEMRTHLEQLRTALRETETDWIQR